MNKLNRGGLACWPWPAAQRRLPARAGPGGPAKVLTDVVTDKDQVTGRWARALR